jgi:hypothetical protein
MIGQGNNGNLMDELIDLDTGQAQGKRFINRKQLQEMVIAMRRDGDEVEEILDSLSDYVVDFKNTVDRPMCLPIVQDVDDGKYGPPRKWMPRNQTQQHTPSRQQQSAYHDSYDIRQPQQIDLGGVQSNVSPMAAQTMGITEQIRDMYFKYIEAFRAGDLDNAMFYKNAFNELLEMRNSMFPSVGMGGSSKKNDDDWVKQLMATMVTNMMQQNTAPATSASGDIFSELEKLGKVKDMMGWNAPQPGGLSENAAIAAMQVAAPELGKLTDTVGQLVQQRQDGQKVNTNMPQYEEMKEKEREIKANYTACPSCNAVIPKWAKACHTCGAMFNDQFANQPNADYANGLPQRNVAARPQTQIPDPGLAGMVNVAPPAMPPQPIPQAVPESQPFTQPSMPMMQPPAQIGGSSFEDEYNDYDEWDELTEQEEWFEAYYPRLQEWVAIGANPKIKIQAVWALAGADEQRQLLYLAQERGADGLVEGLANFVQTHPEHQGAYDFVVQPETRNWVEAMFKEVKLMANEDNLLLSDRDKATLNSVFPINETNGQRIARESAEQWAPMETPQGVPQITPVASDNDARANALRERLKRNQNGQS